MSNIPHKHISINDQRWYQIQNKKYVSVTTALSHICTPEDIAFYLRWGATQKFKSGEDCVKSFWAMMNNASNLGTEVHKAIEDYFNEEPFEVKSDKAKQAFENFLKAKEEYKIQTPEYQEITTWSDDYGYAGTADFIGLVGDKKMVLDWKTGGFKHKHGFQVAMYRQALIEQGVIDESYGTGVLYVSKNDGWYRLYTHRHFDFLFEQGLAALWTHQGVTPNVYRGVGKEGTFKPWLNPNEEYFAKKHGLRPEPEDFENDVYKEEKAQNGVEENL